MEILTTPCKHEHHQIGAYAKAGKVDPTHTTTLRNAFAREMKWRYLTFARALKKAIDERDCFGLKTTHILSMADVTLPGELAFAFPRSSQKVAAFMNWVEGQNKIFLESKGVWAEGIELITAPQLGIGVEDVWTNKYVYSGYQKGLFRGRQELKKAGYNVPSIAESGGIGVAMNQPMHIDRLGLVYSRTYEELKGINASMSSQISRVLSQGMAEGRNPRELAMLLASTVMGPVGGLGITDTLGRFIPAARRAEIMARTEIIRAHHMATVQEYKNWGLEGVQVQAEWATAGDDRVCDECASLEGKIFTLEEIESMIPRHPQCRCIALPIEEKDVEEKKAKNNAEEDFVFGSAEPKSVSPIGDASAGVNETLIVEFKNGSKGVFKPKSGEAQFMIDAIGGDGYRREIAAYKIDRLFDFNIVPETVEWVHEGKIGSLQRFVEGAKDARYVRDSNIHQSYIQALASESYSKMRIFDYLIDNNDRHVGNWMIALEEKTVIAIDHGFSLYANPVTNPGAASTMVPELRRCSRSFLEKLATVSKEELKGVLSILDSEEAIEHVLERFETLSNMILNLDLDMFLKKYS